MTCPHFRGCAEGNTFYFEQNGHLEAKIWPCIVARVSGFQHHNCVLYVMEIEKFTIIKLEKSLS